MMRGGRFHALEGGASCVYCVWGGWIVGAEQGEATRWGVGKARIKSRDFC